MWRIWIELARNYWIVKDIKGSSCELIEVLTWIKPRKTSVRVTCFPAEIRTQNLPNTVLERSVGFCFIEKWKRVLTRLAFCLLSVCLSACVYVSCFNSEQLTGFHKIFLRFSCRKIPSKKWNVRFHVTLLIYELARCSDPCHLNLWTWTINSFTQYDHPLQEIQGWYMSLLWRMSPKETPKIQENSGPFFSWFFT
jgi:hypothetical protein